MSAGENAAALPPLRDDLRLHDGGYDASGMRGVVIEDQLRNRYFRLPIEALEQPEQFQGTVEFLDRNRLLAAPDRGWAELAQEHEASQESLFDKMLHGYLSFRVPLINPEQLLDALLPTARGLASRGFVGLILFIGLAGFYFAYRQWTQFTHMFLDFFSPQGLLLYGVTLVGLKIFHEFGHGLVARAYGCRVPVMGIGFMVLTPMLYTEVSNAWTLKNARHRFHIAAAGVAVELGLACVALFLWAFLPDGPMRAAAYFVCTSAVVATLLVNLSPFMRFDGYHMLADALGLFNLAPRAFAQFNWQARRWLLGPGESPTEILPLWLARLLKTYAAATLVYRASLFSGIALLVYHMFPKVLGVPLGFVEVYFFMWQPVWRELRGWKFSMRLRHGIALAVVVVLLALPLDRHVSIPAIAVPQEESWIHVPETARVEQVLVHDGEWVAAGTELLRLSSDDMSDKLRRSELRLALLDLHLDRIAADARELAQVQVTRGERQSLLDEISGLHDRQARLTLRSPVDGRVNDLQEGLAAGMLVNSATPLLHVAGRGIVIKGLSGQRDAVRLSPGAQATFVAEDGVSASLSARVDYIGQPNGEGVEYLYLSTKAGGPIAMAPEGGRLRAEAAVLPVVLKVAGGELPSAVRGTATIESVPLSLGNLMFSRLVAVTLRESGF
jgi:putative peptide zinc metalloprotease protein